MNRIISLLMLLVWLLQLPWLAAAADCLHETGTAPQHLGHHVHQHQVVDVWQGGDSDPALKPHPNCATCHNLAGGLLASLPVVVSAESDSSNFFHPPVGHLPTAPPGRPERPNWVALA